MTESAERIDTVVIGGGQAGLAVGYHLQRRNVPFVILDAEHRVGDAWRRRWDSLRLFTPARYDRLDGMPFPAPRTAFPTKDEMADYLEGYAEHFGLPVRSGVTVERVARNGGGFTVTGNGSTIESDHVVVAMWNQRPFLPDFSADLRPDIVQMHSTDYRNPSQLREGIVLVVGAGNSGAEIALDVAPGQPTLISGPHPGHLPFPPNRLTAALIAPILRNVFHRVLSQATPVGRRARPKLIGRTPPLVRAKPRHLIHAGVTRVARTVGVVDGRPLLEDGQVLDVANVIWCTGYRPEFSWIDMPVFGDREPSHHRGVVAEQPGLYFVGLQFLYSLSSGQINGVSRDAAHVARVIATRSE